MSTRLTLLRWASGDGKRTAVEWCAEAGPATGPEAALAELAAASGDAAFVIVPLRRIGVCLPAAVHAFRAAGGTARLCVSGERAELARLDLGTLDSDCVGLMLDGVDAETPLADLIWDGIESVRFSGDFVVRAARQLRLGCALESMLGLAHELGLCTLGLQALPGGGCVSGAPAFDYLPAPATPQHAPGHRAEAAAAPLALSR